MLLFIAVLFPSQATRGRHVSRRWTHVPPAPVTTTGRATLKAPGPWDLAAAARPVSLAPRAPSWWTSAPLTPVLTVSAAAWATATGVCVSQVNALFLVTYVLNKPS